MSTRFYSPIVRWFIAAAAATAVVAPASGRAAVNLTPTADALVSAAHPTLNYGAADRLAVAAPQQVNGEFQSLLKFDTSAAKASFDAQFGAGQWRLDGFLTLFYTTKNDPLFNNPVASNIYIDWLPNDSWTEGTGTAASPAVGGGAGGVTYNDVAALSSGFENLIPGGWGGAPDTGGASQLTSSSTHPGFAADVMAGNIVTLRLRYFDASSSVIPKSREFASQTPLWSMSATALPEPRGAVILAAAATATAAGRRRRRAAQP